MEKRTEGRESRNLHHLSWPLNLAVPSHWNGHLLANLMTHFLSPPGLDSNTNSPPSPSLTTTLKQHFSPRPCFSEPYVPLFPQHLSPDILHIHLFICLLFMPVEYKLHKGQTVLFTAISPLVPTLVPGMLQMHRS